MRSEEEGRAPSLFASCSCEVTQQCSFTPAVAGYTAQFPQLQKQLHGELVRDTSTSWVAPLPQQCWSILQDQRQTPAPALEV